MRSRAKPDCTLAYRPDQSWSGPQEYRPPCKVHVIGSYCGPCKPPSINQFSNIVRVRRSPLIRLVATGASLTLAGIGACAASSGGLKTRTVEPVHADTAALRKKLDSIADAHHGIVGYTVIDLESGARISRRGDETFPTASLIKVAILVTVYDLVAKGELSLDDPITLLKIDQVPGSGVLQFLHNGTIITVRDAAWLMSIISDNTATNLLLDRIIIRRVWAKMDSLGLTHTRVHSKSFLRISSVAMTARRNMVPAGRRRTRWRTRSD